MSTAVVVYWTLVIIALSAVSVREVGWRATLTFGGLVLLGLLLGWALAGTDSVAFRRW